MIADTGYGSAEMLNWLVHDRGIEPHIPVFDKFQRKDDTFSREDFTYDHASDTYCCPAGKILQHYRRRFNHAADRCIERQFDLDSCFRRNDKEG